jgi:tetratricopeptide (TPR) repeat protein
VEWEKAQPQDPDLYVAKFNLILSEAEVLNVSTKAAQGGEFSIKDPKTGKEVGSIGGGGYNPAKVQQAMDVLRKGLALAPDRLDIRFGLAKAAELKQDPAQQLATLRDALAWRASAAGKPWRWRDGGALPAPETEFVTSSLEEYMVPYWQSSTPEGYRHGLALAELLLTYYPNSSLGYFNKGNYYAFTDNNAEAYKWFVQADKRNPNDPQNINNLLRISLNLRDKAAAKGYLTRLCQYPDFKADCQHYTAELQKL